MHLAIEVFDSYVDDGGYQLFKDRNLARAQLKTMKPYLAQPFAYG